MTIANEQVFVAKVAFVSGRGDGGEAIGQVEGALKIEQQQGGACATGVALGSLEDVSEHDQDVGHVGGSQVIEGFDLSFDMCCSEDCGDHVFNGSQECASGSFGWGWLVFWRWVARVTVLGGHACPIHVVVLKISREPPAQGQWGQP